MAELRYELGEDEQGKYITYPTTPMGDVGSMTRTYYGAVDQILWATMDKVHVEAILANAQKELDRREEHEHKNKQST